MDDRIRDLKEGAGREESRLNQDFIDFLQKWSTPALLVVAAAAVAYWGFGQYKTMQVAKVNAAAASYAAAAEDGNPDALARVIEQYGSVRSFGLLASLDLADVYLLSAQRGLAPGAVFTGEGSLMEGDVLDDDARRAALDKAARLYADVLDSAGPQQQQLAVEAAFGLAAVAESLGDVDKAKTHLARATELARTLGFDALATTATTRSAGLTQRADRPRLFDAAALPPLPEPAKPQIITPGDSADPQDEPADAGATEDEGEEAPTGDGTGTETDDGADGGGR
jgi:hypothetical protein